MLKEGDATYEQQCDVILKLEHLWLQALSILLDDTTIFCQICEDLKKDLLAINIQSQLKDHDQVQDFFNDHAMFEFRHGLLYHDGSFHSLYQNNNWQKNNQIIFWSCFLVSWSPWKYHF
jgi:hypothetical protein